MAINTKDLEYIEDQLSVFGNFYARKMFGGVGYFREGVMFGMLGGGVLRLKADDTTRERYQAKGMKPFEPYKDGRSMPYWQVPVEILEDREALAEWAEEAYEVALKKKK